MRQKGFIFLPVIIIVLLIGIVGYFTYQNIQTRKNTIDFPQPTNASTSEGTHNNVVNPPNTRPTIDPTIVWETYTNKKFGFEFKYPTSSLLLCYNRPGLIPCSTDNDTLKALKGKQINLEIDVQDYLSSKINEADWNKEENFVNNQNVQCYSQIKSMDTFYYCRIKNTYPETQINIFFTFENDNQISLFKQILSTFKFIK